MSPVQIYRLVSNTDIDNDGLNDDWEIRYFGSINFTNDQDEDIDKDGLTNITEFNVTTNPTIADTDKDNVIDGDDPNPLLKQDADSDGLADDWEEFYSVTSPFSDDDLDGLSNFVEYLLNLNPLSSDSDKDGVSDDEEDSDGDGVSNIQEILDGTDPSISADYNRAHGTPTPTPTACTLESISLDPTPLKLKRGTSDTVTVTVSGNNCLAAGVTVTATTNKAGGKRISISPSSQKTDADGEALFTITAKKKTGNARVTFQAGDLKRKMTVKVGM
mgnify:FL=1